MRLEDLDYDALINQMWGSEANLQSFLKSELADLCARICGPEAPVPTFKVTYPPLKGEAQEGVEQKVAVSSLTYKCESDSAPATILFPALIAGYKRRLPQFIAIGLIHHWEALGAVGENVFSYPEAIDTLLKDCFAGMSENDFRECHSPLFIAKAIKVARDFEMSLGEFLFPNVSLTVHMSQPEQGETETTP